MGDNMMSNIKRHLAATTGSGPVRGVLVDGHAVGLEVLAVVGRDGVVARERALERLLLFDGVLPEGLLELLV